MCPIVLIILLLVILLVTTLNLYEHYGYDYTLFPFWNTRLYSTRNMSYDLRGDIPIYPQYIGPFNNPSRFPIQNPGLSI